MLASLSHFYLGRHFCHMGHIERGLEAAERALAYKLFPYQGSGGEPGSALATTIENRQFILHMSLLGPPPIGHNTPEALPAYLSSGRERFRESKLELIDSLHLLADCMYKVGTQQRSVELLFLAIEAVHLSTGVMSTSRVRAWRRGGQVAEGHHPYVEALTNLWCAVLQGQLAPDVSRSMEGLSQAISITMAKVLPRLSLTKLKELMGESEGRDGGRSSREDREGVGGLAGLERRAPDLCTASPPLNNPQ